MGRHHHPKQPERLDCARTDCACPCRQCSYDYHCGSHRENCHQQCLHATGNRHDHGPEHNCRACYNQEVKQFSPAREET
jgi:hypothetical protein